MQNMMADDVNTQEKAEVKAVPGTLAWLIQKCTQFAEIDRTPEEKVEHFFYTILREPKTDEGIENDEKEKYSPIATLGPSGRHKLYYGETSLSIDRAHKVGGRMDAKKLFAELRSLSSDQKELLRLDLEEISIIIQKNKVPQAARAMTICLIRNRKNGISRITPEDLLSFDRERKIFREKPQEEQKEMASPAAAAEEIFERTPAAAKTTVDIVKERLPFSFGPLTRQIFAGREIEVHKEASRTFLVRRLIAGPPPIESRLPKIESRLPKIEPRTPIIPSPIEPDIP